MRESTHMGSLEHLIRRNSSSGVSWGAAGGGEGQGVPQLRRRRVLFYALKISPLISLFRPLPPPNTTVFFSSMKRYRIFTRLTLSNTSGR